MIYTITLKTEITPLIADFMHRLAEVAAHGDLEYFTIEIDRGSK